VAFNEDQNRYRTARTALGISKLTNTSMHELDDRHLGLLDLNEVAAVIGLPPSDLKRSIDASPQALPPEIVPLRTQGGGIQRDSFESVLGALVQGLGLGQPLVRSNADSQPDAGNNTNSNAAGSSSSASGGSSANNNTAGSGASAGSPDAGTRTMTDTRRRY
jgi:hypothetical protein